METKKIIIGTVTQGGKQKWGQEDSVEIPADATVTNVTYIDPYYVVQYWRPSED